MKYENYSSLVSVRFSSPTRARIVRLSRRFRLPVSEIIRRAVESRLPAWERAGDGRRARAIWKMNRAARKAASPLR